MKRKLHALILIFLVSFLAHAQTAIEQLQSPSGSQYTTMSGSVDQSTSGANVSWDFTASLSPQNVVSVDTYSENGNMATITTTTNGNVSSLISLINPNAEVAISMALAFDVQLNYSDPGVVGTFPLNFGYSNTDNVQGTFSGAGVSGTIQNTSTIVVDVDAWGNLKVGTFDGEVTRLKIVQNLDLQVGFLPTTGTQTSHFYYDANSNDLVFRTTRVVVPLASIDQTSVEVLSNFTLNTKEFTLDKVNVALRSNPVKDILKLDFEGNILIKNVTIYDITGKRVLRFENKTNDFDVSHLKSGLFLLSITTENETLVKKFVKE